MARIQLSQEKNLLKSKINRIIKILMKQIKLLIKKNNNNWNNNHKKVLFHKPGDMVRIRLRKMNKL